MTDQEQQQLTAAGNEMSASFLAAKKRSDATLAKLEAEPGKFTMLTGDRPTGRLHLGHYFGSIKDRVLEFMVDVDEALWKLGIPAKTRTMKSLPASLRSRPFLKAKTWPWTIICWSWRCSGKPPTSMTWSACCMKSPSPA